MLKMGEKYPKVVLSLIVYVSFSCLIVNASILSVSHDDSETEVSMSSSTEYPWQTLLDVEDETFEKIIIPSSIDWQREVFTNHSKISSRCRTMLGIAMENVHQRKSWAIKLFSSWAKFPPSGTWHGTMTDFGDYDQCMNVERSAQYCLIDISIPMPPIPQWHNLYQTTQVLPSPSDDNLSNHTRRFVQTNDHIYSSLSNVSAIFYYVYIQTGVCLPDECTSDSDVRAIGNLNAVKLGMNVTKFTCNSNSRQKLSKYSPIQIFAIIFISLMISLNVFVLFIDKFFTSPESRSKIYYLNWFNPSINIKKIFYSRSNDELTCIHGLRFLTIVWIIAGHTLEWNNMNLYRETFTLRERLSDLVHQPFYKAHYSVDTFFYMSGLLTSYVTLKFTRSDFSRFGVGSFLSLRYLRLTPQLGVFLLLSTLLPGMFDGPLWGRYMNSLNNRCNTNWWINMLYLQNILDLQNICAIHTWYLAVDMQLHWFALIPIIAILLNRTRGLALTKLIIITCTIFSSIWIFLYKLPPGSVITSRNNFLDEQGRPSDYLYFFYKPWTHGAVFFTGFIFGCFVEKFTNKKTKLSTVKRYSLWCLAAVIYLFCCYNTLPWLHGRPYNPVWSAFLHPLNMLMWSFLLSLIVWLCLTNNGGIVDEILSSPMIRPLSRVTYCVYLVHPWAFAFIVATKRELLHPSFGVIVSTFTSIIILSYIIGFIFTVLFEAPLFHLLEKYKNKIEHQIILKENNNGISTEYFKEMNSLARNRVSP